jgi:pimeloyl-ACP methyl ester carboxylesterase
VCNKLREELKYDVFIFDYRGFGDSTGEPTEEGLIQDARYVYDWLHNISNGQRKIYIWGQSLGSSVACQLAARLSDDESMNILFNDYLFIYLGKSLAGIVMEAAFINMHQALQTHYLSLLFRWQPWFYSLTEKALLINKLGFQTRGYLSSINCPCVLLHADDDYTVPYIHGKQLLQAALAARDDNRQKKKLLHFTIDMISFHRAGYGHSRIYQAPKLIPALK